MKTQTELVEFISKNPTASFVDIKRFFGQEFSGDMTMTLPDPYQNIILWSGMSEHVVNTIYGAIKAGHIKPVSTYNMIYLIDGEALRLPIAKKKYKYKTPHWMPTVFSAVTRDSSGR